MARKYTKVEQLAGIARERHNQEETYSEIVTSFGLEKKQLKRLMERQRRKERILAAGYIPRPKGPASEGKQRISGWLTWSWSASGRADRPTASVASSS